MFSKYIIVQVRVPGLHKWPAAPEEVKFLRNAHRHTFTFKVQACIKEDRELEFFLMQRSVRSYLYGYYEMDENLKGDMLNFGERSCETLATELLNRFPEAYACEVWEDNENGSRVERK
jgi:hypothetical protein